MSQWRVPPARTGLLANRWTSDSSTPPPWTRAVITRPLEAPRSTAATLLTATPSPHEAAGCRVPRACSGQPRRVDSRATSSGWNMICWWAWLSGLSHSSRRSSVAMRPSL